LDSFIIKLSRSSPSPSRIILITLSTNTIARGGQTRRITWRPFHPAHQHSQRVHVMFTLHKRRQIAPMHWRLSKDANNLGRPLHWTPMPSRCSRFLRTYLEGTLAGCTEVSNVAPHLPLSGRSECVILQKVPGCMILLTVQDLQPQLPKKPNRFSIIRHETDPLPSMALRPAPETRTPLVKPPRLRPSRTPCSSRQGSPTALLWMITKTVSNRLGRSSRDVYLECCDASKGFFSLGYIGIRLET
jgi:hypothetical protein